jgi:hypothetical protein
VLKKHMPPLPKKVALGDSSWRESFVDRGYLVKLCNETNQAGSDLNLGYYIDLQTVFSITFSNGLSFFIFIPYI